MAMPVAVSMAVAVSMPVGPTLPAASAAARAPSAGPPAIPGRYFISEPCHSVDTKSQSSRNSGERDQCSVVVQPHNITSHLDRNVSYARRVVGGGGFLRASEHLRLQQTRPPIRSLRASAKGQLWV